MVTMKTVLAAGVFDLLHYGHIRYLEEAKKAGGEGARLIDTEGREYLDGVSSLWVNLHGHRRREIRCLIFSTLTLEQRQGIPNGASFAFAGLWETWNKKDGDSIYKSCTIITTEASESIRDIHHRMPVILKPDVYEPWLNPENQEIVGLKNILKHGIYTELASYPVSKQVNSVKNNDPSCIDPVA